MTQSPTRHTVSRTCTATIYLPSSRVMSAPIRRVAKTRIEHVATPSKAVQATATKDFLTIKYEPRPRPLNITTLPSTEQAFHDRSHPHHSKIKRRAVEFDPNLLHWSVRVPGALSKNATVRSWASRRVKEAVRAELKASGFANDGTLLDGATSNTALKGAMVVWISKSQELLLASGEEVRQEASRILKQVIWKCKNSYNPPDHGRGKDERPRKPTSNRDRDRGSPGFKSRDWGIGGAGSSSRPF